MEFPGNSHKVTESDKSEKVVLKKEEVTKIVTGEVIHKKKSLGRRFRDIFFGGEIKNAGRYVTSEVLLPAFKNLVVDATSKGIERIIYGDARPSPRRFDQNRPRVSYHSAAYRDPRQRGTLPDQAPPYSRGGRRQDVGDIILISREEAELVVERLSDIIDKYDVASVADLHDLVGLPTTYVDNKWGWNSLAYVNVRQTREGYLIDLPPVEPI